jgi:hypothetical protein
MSELELSEQIEDYLKNRLSPEARQAFETRLANDPDLAEELALHRDLMAATPPKDVLELRHLMEAAYLQHIENQAKKSDSGWSFKINNRTRLAAAASVALVVTAGIWWWQRSPTPQFVEVPPIQIDTTKIAEKTTPIDTPIEKPPVEIPPSAPAYAAAARSLYDQSPYTPGTLMGSETPDESLLQKATDAYAKNRFGEAVQLLDTLPTAGRTDALKLRAHARFRLGRYAQAAGDFEELTRSFSYRNDAEWHLLLCHAARLPKTKAAYEALLAKVSAPGHPFEQKALELKKRLARG